MHDGLKASQVMVPGFLSMTQPRMPRNTGKVLHVPGLGEVFAVRRRRSLGTHRLYFPTSHPR